MVICKLFFNTSNLNFLRLADKAHNLTPPIFLFKVFGKLIVITVREKCMIQGQCDRRLCFGHWLRKMLQLQGNVVPLTPYQGTALDPIHCTLIIFRQLYPALHPGLVLDTRLLIWMLIKVMCCCTKFIQFPNRFTYTFWSFLLQFWEYTISLKYLWLLSLCYIL